MLRRKMYAARLAFAALTLAFVVPASAQVRRAGATAQADAGPATRLPASDGVLLVEMRRLLSEGVPRVFGNDQARVAVVNADLDQFKTQTGIDPRAVERVAVGARFVELSAGVLKIDHVVAVASGAFDEKAIIAAGRQASAAGGHRELKHGGKTVHVFRPNRRMKIFGVTPSMNVRELAVCVLDANTVAVGDVDAARAAIDAGAGRGRVSPDLLALARQTPNALVGFAANAPRALLRKAEGLGQPSVEQAIASIRQFYGSLAASASGFDLLASARTASPADARRLSETVTALKSVAAFAASQLQGDRRRLAQNAVESLQVVTQGSDVRLSLSIPQADMPVLLRAF